MKGQQSGSVGLEYTHGAARDLARLPRDVVDRILRKMEWFAGQKVPLSFAKPLKERRFGSHRFRIGDYRVFVEVRDGHMVVLLVLAVRHRKDAYRL